MGLDSLSQFEYRGLDLHKNLHGLEFHNQRKPQEKALPLLRTTKEKGAKKPKAKTKKPNKRSKETQQPTKEKWKKGKETQSKDKETQQEEQRGFFAI